VLLVAYFSVLYLNNSVLVLILFLRVISGLF
jgi:hypothetical protein